MSSVVTVSEAWPRVAAGAGETPGSRPSGDRGSRFGILDERGQRQLDVRQVSVTSSRPALYWLTFYGLAGARDAATPTVFVHSDGCVLSDNVRAVAAAMPAAELVWDGSQIDFYDQPAQVDSLWLRR